MTLMNRLAIHPPRVIAGRERPLEGGVSLFVAMTVVPGFVRAA
jgi:hypothetical protein